MAVIDRLTRPLPEAAFKVGESSNELGTHYFGQVLQLDSYFRTRHLPKLGLRFFMGGAQGPVTARPEAGQSMFPPVPSYQIDRGRLETDLREIVVEMGVVLFEGTSVEDVELADGEAAHVIRCRRKEDSERFVLTGHWVVDALGRRCLLQSKLGLKREHGHRASAAWWRYSKRVDVDEMGVQDGQTWRYKLIEDRYFSTNHFMGRGYWVWFIPLGSGATSVGIVTDEDIHPQNTYGKSYMLALEWLQKNEPKVWEFIRDEPPMDFLSLKRFSYASAQVFSYKRWTCVGEAGFFLDPLYSYGSDFIAVMNTLTVELIRHERAGTLTEKTVADYNRLVLDNLFQICFGLFQGTYRTFGHAQIVTPKLTWDTAIYWSWMYHLYVQKLLFDPTEEIFALGERFKQLNTHVEQLFTDWSEKSAPRPLYLFADLTRMRLMMLLGLDLASRRSPEQAIMVARKNLDRLEELALVLFWQAVSECYPDHPLLEKKPWANAWRIHLNPEKWEEDGVFSPDTAPRSLKSMRDNFTGIFAAQSLREIVLYEFPYRMLHWGKGFMYYHIVPLIRRIIFVNKPALWVRRFLVKDYPSKPVES